MSGAAGLSTATAATATATEAATHVNRTASPHPTGNKGTRASEAGYPTDTFTGPATLQITVGEDNNLSATFEICTDTGTVIGAGFVHAQGTFAASHMTGTAYVTHGTGQWM